MTFKAAFLVKSPLQYLEALEARAHFKLSSSECALIMMGDRKSLVQLKNLVNFSNDWGYSSEMADIPLTCLPSKDRLSKKHLIPNFLTRNKILNVWKLSYLARIFGKTDYVFLGDISHYLMRHFANRIDSQKVVLLDDGNATLNIVDVRYGRKDFLENTPRKRKLQVARRLKWKRRLLGLDDHFVESVTFFTTYDFVPEGKDKVIRHNFENLRSKANEIDWEETVYFLGSPLVEAGILSEQEYFAQLRKVATYFAGRKVTYIRHRRENARRLTEIRNFFDWETESFDFPLEFQLVMIGPRPQIISSFISAALENCRLIFGDDMEVISFRLDPDHFHRSMTGPGQGVRTVYDYYEKNAGDAFKIVDLGQY